VNIRDIVGLTAVIPALTVYDVAHAVPLARALTGGGLRVLEVELNTPAALACIEAMRGAVPEAVVGVGTLTRPADFAAAGRAGAQFGVTPGLTPELAAAARGARFPLLPGVMTPTEVIAARNSGFTVLKLLPADAAGGVRMLSALGGLFNDIDFCPAVGISPDNASDYLALPNVVCVSGSWVAPRALIDLQDWGGIESLARLAASLRASRV
jgi:2-dehydro-3-deoxyphosphogluconate aldolase / (4S)-4-hydroxy-2-oxoglutarate aldolase